MIAPGIKPKCYDTFIVGDKICRESAEKPPGFICGEDVKSLSENVDVDSGIKAGLTKPRKTIRFLRALPGGCRCIFPMDT